MSSAGQAIGMVVGGVVGFFAGGNVALGASIGGAIGGYIDPPKGPKAIGPRLDDLRVQTATYGAVIPRIYGTVATYGNIFWVENDALKEVEKTESQGGKGGGGAEVTTFSYFATFAVGICQGPVDGIRRIWAGSKLIYDAGSNDIGAILASNASADMFTIYLGTADQLPDDRMQAALGVANVPAYRGLVYIVFKDFALADYGNSLLGCPIKVEVVSESTATQYSRRVYIDNIYAPFYDTYGAGNKTGPFDPRLDGGVIRAYKSTDIYTVDIEGTLISSISAPAGAGSNFHIGTLAGQEVKFYQTINIGGGTLRIGGAIFKTRDGTATASFCGAAVRDELLYVLMCYSGVGALEIYDAELNLLSTSAQDIMVTTAAETLPFVPGTQASFCVEAGGAYLWAFVIGGSVANEFLYSISDAGALSLVWQDDLAFQGVHGDQFCAIAENGLCWILSNGGALTVFDRNLVITAQTVSLGSIVSAECLASGLLSAGDIDVTGLTQMVRGYRVASLGSIRAAIEPLQSAWPFDAIQDGYKIKFVMRGGASVATVQYDDLGATNGENAPRIRRSREMDTQIPRKVTATYIDALREYETGSGPGAERLNTDSVNEIKIELPIVLTATEAAGVEEKLLYLYWLERHEFSIVLPPTYTGLQPADVIALVDNSSTHSVRLAGINYLPDGRLECSARMASSTIYIPAAVGEEGASSGQVLTYPGASVAAMLDIPCVHSSYMDKPGFVGAMAGYLDTWRGGVLFRSDDSGQSWVGAQGFNPPPCVFGTAYGSIGAGSTHVIDEASSISVLMAAGSLSSVSLSQLYNGANHFAYGAHGRWEIIAARTCTPGASGTYVLSGLMRGRFGTERNMTSHATGDTVALLDANTVRFIGMGIDSLNLTRLYRAVSTGMSLYSVADMEMAYTGENLKCLSPVYLNGNRAQATQDWSLSWTRRTRTAVEPFSGLNQPLGESSEAYEVEIWDAGYTTLKRTITGLTAASCSYTVAQQTTDFGAPQATLYVRVFQLSSSVGRGYPLQASITAAVHEDTYIANLVIGLHMDDTGLTDVKGHAITLNGNVARSATQAKFGGYSAYFDGTGDYLSVTGETIGTGDYTIDGWIWVTTPSSLFVVFDSRNSDESNTNGLVFYVNSSSKLVFGRGAPFVGTAGTTSVTGGAWHYVELCRSSGTVRGFLDGNMEIKIANSDNLSLNGWRFGHLWNASGTHSSGYIDDIRVTKAARRTSDSSYSIPAGAFPNP